MARLFNAQVSKWNGTAIGGLARITLGKQWQRVFANTMEGAQGGPFATEKGQDSVFGTFEHQDLVKLLTIQNAAVSTNTTEWYTQEAGAATFTKHALKNPVMGNVGASLRIGSVATVNHQFRCRFASGDARTAIYIPTGAVAAATVAALGPIAPVPVHEAITISHVGTATLTPVHIQSFDFNLTGSYLTEADPNEKGETMVEFVGPRELTFSVGFQDSDVASSANLADRLVSNGVGSLFVTCKVPGGTNRLVTLANAVFTGVDEDYPTQGVSGFTLQGRCNWVDADGTTVRTVSGLNPILVITTV